MLLISLNSYAEVDYLILKSPGHKQLKISRSELEKLPPYTITTSTNFTTKDTFVGAKVSDFIKNYEVTGSKIRAFSWDTYSFTLTIDEAVKYNAIIAYKKSGKYMNVSELGPFAIIYPRDENPELERLSVDAKTVWQVKMLEVK
jgi:hypothetical protein